MNWISMQPSGGVPGSSLSSPVIHPKRARPSQDEEMMDYYPNSADPPRCAARRTVEGVRVKSEERDDESSFLKSTSLPSSPTHYGYTNQLQFFGHNDAKPEMGHSAEALLPMNYLFSMIKSDQPTVCVMCYKKADVMHYGVAACATCKTFFRRSLLSDRELHCKRKEECFEQPEYWNVVKNAQRPGQCTWCRLNRFVTRGMNPCAISPGPGKDLFEYPNIVKIFDTRKRDSALIFDLVEEYKRVRITVLDDSLEDIFWSVRRSDKKHRQLRASEFNPSPKTRFNWDLKDYFGQPREMDDDIRELIWARSESTKGTSPRRDSGDNDDEEESVVRSDRRRTLPLFALQKNWHYVDTICSIEYVKYFVATMKLELDQTDQMTILRKTVVQIKLLEMYHFSWLAGFDQLTFPDGTHKSKILWNTNPRADTLLEMITSLSLSRAELSIIKAIVICNTDQISPAGRELLETLKVKLSKILISFCIQKFDHSIGIVRVTAIMDLFYALEAQKSDEIQQHVIAYLTKKEPAIMRDLYFRSD